MGILDNIGAPPTIGMPPIMMPNSGAQPPPMPQPAPQAQQLYPGLKKPPPPIGTTVNGYTYLGGDPRSKDPAVWKQASGDDFLNSLPISDDKKDLIKMMTAYEAPASGNRGVGTPEVQQLVGFAKRYDPTFDIKTYKVRQDYLHDLNDQKANGTIQALNNAAMHAKSFDDEFQKLGNSNWMPQFANRWMDYVGSAPTQKAAGAASTTANFLGPEIAKVAQGGAATVDEVNRQMDQLDVGTRPNVENGTMASMAQKIGDRTLSMQAQYRRAFGNTPMKEPLLTPQAADAVHQLLKRYAPDYENKLDYQMLTAGGYSPDKAKQIASPGQAQQVPHPQDQAAIAWAKANSNDPRAAKILSVNGAQ